MKPDTTFTVYSVKKVPEGVYFLVLHDDGYGDDAHMQHTVCMELSDLEDWVRRHDEGSGNGRPYRILRVAPVGVHKTVSFKFDES